MLRTSICLMLVLCISRTCAAQGFGNTTTRPTTGATPTTGAGGFGQTGTGGATGTGGTTGTGGATGAGGLAAASATAPGSGFTFDPRFGATSIGNAFSSGMGGGLGGIGGIGGLGGGVGGLTGSRFGGGFGGFGGGFGGRGGFGQTQQQNQTKIRATAKVGFDYQVPSAQTQATTIRSTMARLPLPARFNQAQIQFNGRQAIVTGNFSNEDDVAVLKRLLLLEPGVEDVDVKAATVRSAASTEVVPSPPVAQ